jgi:hypothetical protein
MVNRKSIALDHPSTYLRGHTISRPLKCDSGRPLPIWVHPTLKIFSVREGCGTRGLATALCDPQSYVWFDLPTLQSLTLV